MKYMTSSTRKVEPAVKPFDFQAAYEGLSETFDRINDAYKELVAAESNVAEAEEILMNCQNTIASFEKYGLTAQGLENANGDNHDLDRALGFADIAVESLSSMNKEALESLTQKYIAGLEAAEGSAWSKLVEGIKAFFAKIINWLKELFTGSAKLMAMVKQTDFSKLTLDGEKKINGISAQDARALCGDIQKAVAAVEAIDKGTGEAQTATITMPERKQETLAALGWDTDQATTVANMYTTLPVTTKLDAAWKKIQSAYKAVASRAKAAVSDDEKAAELKTQYENWKLAGKLTGQISSAMRLIGFTLMAVSKATKKEENV